MAGSETAPAFDPDGDRAHLVYIPAAVFFVICPVLMGLRIWARLGTGGKLGADDWTAIVALVSGTVPRNHALSILKPQSTVRGSSC
ncbi:hypothetical protein MYCTH_2304420 [Thermothelomyces thermophilus ATCC 42464]|uniref:Uncharacterized protein n=1 Tax=Thermothelomyces thermophilus (strain ATCC 42464 / BCRC 31852 / DSM 1799) TaxID=573729 RepID=G2QEL0_THET4|nr:uncharacterized protein MYCTH_2304420 [Thermothelomyces thermophilus ATCC 42464]AEO57793.1 hypothetical protein MYCTH_2304420 [Thermothelomyces thermophilus ATCC 42464]